MRNLYKLERKGFSRTFMENGKAIKLYTYLMGLQNVDLMNVAFIGEDFEHNTMRISIWDLPDYLKQGARLDLKMDKKDIELIKNFIDNQ